MKSHYCNAKRTIFAAACSMVWCFVFVSCENAGMQCITHHSRVVLAFVELLVDGLHKR